MGILEADGLAALLDAAARNQAVIANNLANVNTPGYQTARVRFADELEALLDEQGNLLPGKSIETEMYHPFFGDAGPDGNNVVLEREIVELNKNAMTIKLYLAVLGSRIRRLSAAIDGR
jgi:flagellar basal-body rod protein FlgB